MLAITREELSEATRELTNNFPPWGRATTKMKTDRLALFLLR